MSFFNCQRTAKMLLLIDSMNTWFCQNTDWLVANLHIAADINIADRYRDTKNINLHLLFQTSPAHSC